MPSPKERTEPQRKPWFKFWSREYLEGSLRFENEPAERSVWLDLLAMANESRNRGVIQANPITPYPHDWLARKLVISLELLESCLAKFTAQERISENSNGITILNWGWYQEQMTGKRGRPRKVWNPGQRRYADQGKYDHLVQR